MGIGSLSHRLASRFVGRRWTNARSNAGNKDTATSGHLGAVPLCTPVDRERRRSRTFSILEISRGALARMTCPVFRSTGRRDFQQFLPTFRFLRIKWPEVRIPRGAPLYTIRTLLPSPFRLPAGQEFLPPCECLCSFLLDQEQPGLLLDNRNNRFTQAVNTGHWPGISLKGSSSGIYPVFLQCPERPRNNIVYFASSWSNILSLQDRINQPLLWP